MLDVLLFLDYETSFSKLIRLFNATISGTPIIMTTNSPIATVSQVKKNGTGNSEMILISIAMMNIVKVKTSVLNIIRFQIPLINRAEKIVIESAMIDCPTPNTKSITPSGENRFVMKTPITMPKIYFLLKTTR